MYTQYCVRPGAVGDILSATKTILRVAVRARVDQYACIIYHLQGISSSHDFPDTSTAFVAFADWTILPLGITAPLRMKSVDANNNERILKHGYLLKQSERLKQWHLRYFVLSKECLCYYRSEKESIDDTPKEVIFFNDMSLYIDELQEKQTKYCLKLVKRSLSPGKIATRTLFLCCFSEHERNEWLSQILQAKAIALVVDPTAWMGNQEASAEDMDFELTTSGSGVKFASAKEILQRCRRKLSLSGNARDSRSYLFLDDWNVNRRRKSTPRLSQEWRNTLMVI